jgi:hypothetical protein
MSECQIDPENRQMHVPARTRIQQPGLLVMMIRVMPMGMGEMRVGVQEHAGFLAVAMRKVAVAMRVRRGHRSPDKHGKTQQSA